MAKQILIGVMLVAMVAGSTLAATAAAPQVNINTATADQLKLLPRVGASLAQRIMEFRAANGPFKAPEELARVKGIGEKKFALLQPHVCISGPTTLSEKVKVPRAAKSGKKATN
jgi:competence protein ComEA